MAITGLKFNTGYVKTGGVAIQPKPVAHVILAQKTYPLLVAKGSAFAKTTKGLQALITSIKSPIIHVPPITRIVRTPIIPIHTEKAPVQADNQFQQKFKQNTTKFQPYQSLTGISQERPEIIMLTEFLPIFDDNFKGRLTDHVSADGYISGLNAAGSFLDIQMQVANLQHYNVALLVESLKNDDQTAQVLKQQQQDFYASIANLTNHSDYLYQTVTMIEQLKNTFNMLDQNFAVPFDHVTEVYFNVFTIPLAVYSTNQTAQNITVTTLLSNFQYNPANIADFTSSKVYLQLLYEFDQQMRNFSYKLLNKRASLQAADKTAVDILQHASPPNNIPVMSEMATIAAPVYSDLRNLNIFSVLSATDDLIALSKGILSNVNIPTINDRAAVIATLLSKEYRYSSSLSNSETRRILQEFYAYQVNNTGGNTSLFDFIVGRIGSKVSNIFASVAPYCLTAAGQFTVNNVAVLSFEDSYIENDGSVFTPGTDYLIDSILTTNVNGGFNYANLLDYVGTINNIANKFAETMVALRCFHQLPATFDLNIPNPDIIESPEMFLDYCTRILLDTNFNAKTEILDDVMSGIMNLAVNDPTLKSLLFMYFTLRSASGNFANVSHVLETVISNIITRIQALVPDQVSNVRLNISTSRFSSYGFGLTAFIPPKLKPLPGTREYDLLRLNVVNQNNPHSLLDVPEESITQALRAGSPAITAILTMLNFVDTTFTRNLAYSNDLTLYSQMPHTTIQFLAFDLMLTLMNATVNKKITGKYVTRTFSNVGKQFYTTTSKAISGISAVNDTRNKAKAEVDLTLQTVMGIIAILRNIIDSALNVTNYLGSPNSIATLNDISTILGDRSWVKQLMSEQQIILLKSIVDDLNDRVGNQQDQTEAEIDTQDQSQVNDDIQFLDDTVVTTNTRNALFSFLGSRKFSGKEAHDVRLLTIGVPQNFTKQLKEKIQIDKVNDKNFNRKILDVVSCNVYKTDIEYQDIIFKPQKFLFELNRFVQRDNRGYRSIIIDGEIPELLEAIPTIDYSVSNHSTFVATEYGRQNGQSRLYADPEYSFLTTAQKDELLENHITSLLLEIYIKFMTGVSTSEYNFFIDENQALKNLGPQIIDRFTQTIVNQAPLSSPYTVGKDNIDSYDIHRSGRDTMMQQLKSVSTLCHVNTSLADSLQAAKKILTPKMFDRVFNIPVSPNDFEIDLAETQRNPMGKEALHKLIQTHMVYTLDGQEVVSDLINQNTPVKIQDRHRAENHVIFEKYFVTFETVLQSEV